VTCWPFASVCRIIDVSVDKPLAEFRHQVYPRRAVGARALFEPAFDEIMGKVYPEMNAEERAELRAWTLEAFDDDRIDVEFPQTFTIAMVFRLSIELGPIFHGQMQWTYLQAPKPAPLHHLRHTCFDVRPNRRSERTALISQG
jgi:hypothetical protein